MKAAVYYGPKDIRVEERPKPTADHGGVVIKVEACGVCNILESDAWLRKAEGDAGLVLGHEYAGQVVEVGPGVNTIKVGDRIFGEPVYRPCHTCDACLAGDYWRCSNWIRGAGKYGTCGAFAEYFLIPFVNEVPGDEIFLHLPRTMGFHDLTLIEPLMLSMGLAKKAKRNETVVVLGQEILGLGTVAAMKRMGIAGKILASDISKRHLAAAEEVGADVVVNCFENDVVDVVMKETNGHGADLVLVLDRRPAAFFQAVNMLRQAGRIFMGTGYNIPWVMESSGAVGDVHSISNWAGPVGAIQKQTFHFDPGFLWAQTAWGTLGPKLPRIREAIDLVQSGAITAEKHITHVLPLDKIMDAFEIAFNPHESIKVIVEP